MKDFISDLDGETIAGGMLALAALLLALGGFLVMLAHAYSIMVAATCA